VKEEDEADGRIVDDAVDARNDRDRHGGGAREPERRRTSSTRSSRS